MTIRLRPYQRDLARDLAYQLAERGRRDVGLEAPMGSGKTTVCKAVVMALRGSGVVRLVVVLAPLDNIVEAWAKAQARAAGLLDGRAIPAWNEAQRATVARLADPNWWATATGVWVATRQAACSAKATAALKASGADLSGVLVVADEAHHHNDRTRAGEHAAVVRGLGGAVLLVSGTPWHARGSVFTEGTEVVRLSAAEFARHRDARGRPYAPTEWRVERRHVGEASDARAAVEPAGGKDPEACGPKAADVCAQIAADWLADGRPCAVINLPWVSWRAPMLKALRTAAPDARALDLVGDGDDAARAAALAREAECKRYEDRTVDVVLSCARMNEGTDWPLCAAVYNVRIPGSAQLILQRWARAARGKWGIEGYPEQWRDVQLLRFYVPRLTGDATGDAWDQHRDLALMLACYLEDYQRAQEWAAVLGSPRARFEGRLGDRTAPTRRTAPGAAPEIDPVEAARIRAHALQAAGRPAATMAAVIADLRKRHPGIAPVQLKSLAVGTLETEGIDLPAKLRAAEAGVLKPGKASTVVRAELTERWAAIADEFAHVMVSPRSDLVAVAARFSAEDAHEVAQRLRDEGAARGFAWPETREGLIAFAQEHGRRYFKQHGMWPWQESGTISGFDVTWRMLNGVLVYRYGMRLPQVFGKLPKLEAPIRNARAICAFYEQQGRWPWPTAKTPHERQLGRALQHLRRTRHDLCAKYNIPLRADRAQVTRERFAGRAAVDLRTVAPIFCVAWRCSQASQDVGGKSGWAWNTLLRRGLGSKAADRCQVDSVSRFNDEIAADCWRLWLDGADKPDPRPWADILAAGDNRRVVKAERVAFLDWTDLDQTGRPKRKPWSPPAANGLAVDLAAAE